jgi:hypothetical protein
MFRAATTGGAPQRVEIAPGLGEPGECFGPELRSRRQQQVIVGWLAVVEPDAPCVRVESTHGTATERDPPAAPAGERTGQTFRTPAPVCDPEERRLEEVVGGAVTRVRSGGMRTPHG